MSPYVSISAEIRLKSTKFQIWLLWLVTSCHVLIRWCTRFPTQRSAAQWCHHCGVPHRDASEDAASWTRRRSHPSCRTECSICRNAQTHIEKNQKKSKRFERFWVFNLMERLMWTNFAQEICECLTWRNGHVDTIRPPVVLLTDSMSWLTVSVLHGWQISLKPCNTFGCYFVHFSQETYQKDP